MHGRDQRAKENPNGTAPAFAKCPALLGFKQLVMDPGRVHKLLGTPMKANLFLREEVLAASYRAVGDTEVRPVSMTNSK